MPEQHYRHAAIMFTDIVGYTSKMGMDEAQALEMLRKNRDIHTASIAQYKGTLIKEMGDGMLLSFELASDAVRCAVEIQKACSEQDIPLKIGIHEGEVLFEGDDVLGAGVNVASRLQEDASQGSILISGVVYSDVKNKEGIIAEYIDEKAFKNVDEKIKVYQVLYDGSARDIKPVKKLQVTASTKKSIIVLPFVNMSPDPDQEFFSDGLTEEIITDLSHIHDLMVLSRNSSMTFKNSGLTTRKIAEKVNVRYVLEGSVRKAGNDLRITAQLIDGLNEAHLWSEKYAGTLDDVFDIQEKVSCSIAETLEIHLRLQEKKIIAEHAFENSAVYELYLKAKDNIFKFSEASILKAIRYLNDGLDIVGPNAYLYSGLAMAYANLVNIGSKPYEYIQKAEDSVKKALALDPDFQKAHAVYGWIYHLGDPHKSAYHLKKALKLSPNDAFAMLGLMTTYVIHVGKISISKSLLDRIERIDPLDPFTYAAKGMFYFYNGLYDRAEDAWHNYNKMDSDSIYSQFDYALALCYQHKLDDAIPIFDRCALNNPDNAIAKMGQILKHGLLKDKKEVFRLLTPDFVKTCERDVTYSFHLAGIFTLLGEKEKALDWLDSAINSGLINYPLFTRHDPWIAELRGEKRFLKLMERVKLAWENFENNLIE